jgi:cytochrome b561
MTEMTARNQSTRYGSIAQILHWTTALLAVALLVIGKMGLVDAEHAGSAGFMWHGSLGVLVLALVAARFLWRLVSPPPQFPSTMSRAARIAATTMHVSLYALLVALPLSGWLAASAEGSPVNFFNVATVPVWAPAGTAPVASAALPRMQPAPEAAGEGSEDLAKEAHELLGDALIILVGLHVLAALKHQFVDHDGLIRRMLPASRPKSA